MATNLSVGARTGERPAVELAAMLVGATFALVGILGFIPGVTQNFDAMTFAGHDSGAELLGIFQVSILHNIVHLLFGVVGLAAARSLGGARTYLVGGGAVYVGLWLYGMLVDKMSGANFVPINDADDWLHLGLGAAMIVVGLALGSRATAR